MVFPAEPHGTPWHSLSGAESRNFECPISLRVHLGSIEQVRGTEIPKGDIVRNCFPCLTPSPGKQPDKEARASRWSKSSQTAAKTNLGNWSGKLHL